MMPISRCSSNSHSKAQEFYNLWSELTIFPWVSSPRRIPRLTSEGSLTDLLLGCIVPAGYLRSGLDGDAVTFHPTHHTYMRESIVSS